MLWSQLGREFCEGLEAAGWNRASWDRLQRVTWQEKRPAGCSLHTVPNLTYQMELAAVKSMIRPGLGVDQWGRRGYQQQLAHLDPDSVDDNITRIDGNKARCSQADLTLTAGGRSPGCSSRRSLYNGVRRL